MKTIIKRAAALFTMLCMSLILPAYASEALTARAVLNLETNQLLISGTAASAKGALPLILEIKKEPVSGETKKPPSSSGLLHEKTKVINLISAIPLLLPYNNMAALVSSCE